MKKALCLLLAALLLCVASGCAQKEENIFKSENEIFTYQRIDPEKTQIVVSRIGNINVQQLCEAFEAANSDIQVIYLDITGGNADYQPLTDWITRGYKPDVVLSAASFFDDVLKTEYFENLSADPIIQDYEASALQRTAVNNEVYSLPGPSDIVAMMYNKTLFDKYGWEVPVTFDEFVALCDQITADTNGTVEPWNPNAKYSDELLSALEAFTYEELFGGVENRAWYNDFISGDDAFTGHMEPYMEVIQTLAEHNILREEHFSYSATTRGKEFSAGNIAMINMNIYNADNDEFDFDYMPFPTTKGELGYLCDSYSCYVGVPIKERTVEQDKAVRRFLEFFTSPEGQNAYIGTSLKVSNVKGVAINTEHDLAALQPAIDTGHLFARMNFASPEGKKSSFDLHQMALDITIGAATAAECVARVDSAPTYADPAVSAEAPEVLAVAEKDMTVLETSFFIADMYREAADADIGLIANNDAFRGNLMRVFAGDITPGIVTVLKPRSFANDSTLVKASMTGRQLMDALNAPMGNERIPECIYAYSGLKCEVAPWNEQGSKYLSVKLADGSELDMDKFYTVAFWSGTVADEFITETLEAYEGTWQEHMTAKLVSGGISPADDGRIKLVWDAA